MKKKIISIAILISLGSLGVTTGCSCGHDVKIQEIPLTIKTEPLKLETEPVEIETSPIQVEASPLEINGELSPVQVSLPNDVPSIPIQITSAGVPVQIGMPPIRMEIPTINLKTDFPFPTEALSSTNLQTLLTNPGAIDWNSVMSKVNWQPLIENNPSIPPEARQGIEQSLRTLNWQQLFSNYDWGNVLINQSQQLLPNLPQNTQIPPSSNSQSSSLPQLPQQLPQISQLEGIFGN